MSPRSFFLILLKVLGLIMIKDLYFAVGKVLENLIFYRNSAFYGDETGLWFVVTSVIVAGGMALIVYVLIFRSVIILNKLNLDEGFYDERFSFKMDYDAVIRIAILSTSIYLLVDEIPNFCSYVARYYSYQSELGNDVKPRFDQFVLSLAKIVIGGLMINNTRFLARYILSKSREEEDNEEQ